MEYYIEDLMDYKMESLVALLKKSNEIYLSVNKVIHTIYMDGATLAWGGHGSSKNFENPLPVWKNYIFI